MKPKTLLKWRAHPGSFDKDAMLASRNLREFDITSSPALHGFKDTDDYWTRLIPNPVWSTCAFPLLLNAQNDPFLPAWALPGKMRFRAMSRGSSQGTAGMWASWRRPRKGGLRWMARRVFGF